jgi:hypothetical protein
MVDLILGAGAPTRTIPLLDDDSNYRYYPQAVVRQMNFPAGLAPSLSGYDVAIQFNSNANFYFLEATQNNATIQTDQYSFLTVALHEYISNIID